ncbi:hypothetical protein K435DRAFT_804725 [Dendrothele bispora CBS 962.96]|uniref:Uncharacterized protein n=1 Tax=Dendrothele bispora (strain CBS 962.96) TaxID=1314807 RepID=A0A4S8LDE6_DENBC|nr:hypothetical protein K435DRAFT_804725 [Dendrothele bispora CBS 962.96]
MSSTSGSTSCQPNGREQVACLSVTNHFLKSRFFPRRLLSPELEPVVVTYSAAPTPTLASLPEGQTSLRTPVVTPSSSSRTSSMPAAGDPSHRGASVEPETTSRRIHVVTPSSSSRTSSVPAASHPSHRGATVEPETSTANRHIPETLEEFIATHFDSQEDMQDALELIQRWKAPFSDNDVQDTLVLIPSVLSWDESKRKAFVRTYWNIIFLLSERQSSGSSASSSDPSILRSESEPLSTSIPTDSDLLQRIQVFVKSLGMFPENDDSEASKFAQRLSKLQGFEKEGRDPYKVVEILTRNKDGVSRWEASIVDDLKDFLVEQHVLPLSGNRIEGADQSTAKLPYAAGSREGSFYPSISQGPTLTSTRQKTGIEMDNLENVSTSISHQPQNKARTETSSTSVSLPGGKNAVLRDVKYLEVPWSTATSSRIYAPYCRTKGEFDLIVPSPPKSMSDVAAIVHDNLVTGKRTLWARDDKLKQVWCPHEWNPNLIAKAAIKMPGHPELYLCLTNDAYQPLKEPKVQWVTEKTRAQHVSKTFADKRESVGVAQAPQELGTRLEENTKMEVDRTANNPNCGAGSQRGVLDGALRNIIRATSSIVGASGANKERGVSPASVLYSVIPSQDQWIIYSTSQYKHYVGPGWRHISSVGFVFLEICLEQLRELSKKGSLATYSSEEQNVVEWDRCGMSFALLVKTSKRGIHPQPTCPHAQNPYRSTEWCTLRPVRRKQKDPKKYVGFFEANTHQCPFRVPIPSLRKQLKANGIWCFCLALILWR